MNRRSFLKKLGTGVAIAAVAPLALESDVRFFSDETLMSAWGSSGPVTEVIREYADYSNFSQFATQEAIDDIVMKAAEELGHRAGLSMVALQARLYDGANCNQAV